MKLEQVHEWADALTDPHQHTERFEVWDENRHKKQRTHTTTQLGLLAQLAELMLPSSSPEPGDGVAGSRPPGRWDAVATHATITIAAVKWCWSLRLDQRETVESNIRQLVGAFPTMDADARQAFGSDVRSWHRQAEIVAGWKSAPMDPCAPCPALVRNPDGTSRDCGERSLRIQLSDAFAFCASCGTEWDTSTIGLLAEAVRAYKAATDAAADVVRAKARAEKAKLRGVAS